MQIIKQKKEFLHGKIWIFEKKFVPLQTISTPKISAA